MMFCRRCHRMMRWQLAAAGEVHAVYLWACPHCGRWNVPRTSIETI